MQEQLSTYFQGEKLGALAFGLAGVFAVIVAIAVLRLAPAYRAILYPLLIVAAVELGVCGALQLRTDSRVARLQEQLRSDPAGFQRAELARIRGLMVAFRVIEVIEIAMFLGGAALCFALRERPAAFAVGLGLILQGAAMLACDLAAERRAHAYLAALENLS